MPLSLAAGPGCYALPVFPISYLPPSPPLAIFPNCFLPPSPFYLAFPSSLRHIRSRTVAVTVVGQS